MSQETPPASQVGPAAPSADASPNHEAIRILTLRRVELASYSRHLERLKRRQREQEDHLAHTRRQVDQLMERSRQQIAHIQSTSPERIAELEKSLAQARSEAETQRREAARLAGDKARLEALAGQAGKTPELEKIQTQARNDKAQLAAKVAELEQALTKARHEAETQRSEVARMSAEKNQAAGKALQLEQALSLTQKELQATRRQIEQLQESADRIAHLEELLTAAAGELEVRDQQIAALQAKSTPPASAEPNLEEIVAAVRTEFEDLHQAELQRLNLDIDALRKGNAKLRQELDQRKGGAAPAAPLTGNQALLAKENDELKARLASIEVSVQKLADENQQLKSQPKPAADLAPLTKENEELKTRLANLEPSVQKLYEENQKYRGLSAELEQERNGAIESLERESAQFNQQRRDLEDEVRALRKKLDEGETAQAAAAQADLDLMADMMAGEIVPEPDSGAEIELEDPVPEETVTPLSAVNLEQGFDFTRGDAKLVGLKRMIENDHRLLELELSDPKAHHDDRQLTDLEQQKILVDGLLEQVRRSQEALIGRPSSPPVVVAPTQPQRPKAKPRNSFQGLRRWLKGG